MRGQRIGSVRVSTVDQPPERYLEQVQVDRVSTDTASGKETTRPALAALRTFVREGDPYGMPLDHRTLEPYWQAAADYDLGVALHTFTVMPPYAPGGLRPHVTTEDRPHAARRCSLSVSCEGLHARSVRHVDGPRRRAHCRRPGPRHPVCGYRSGR